MSLTPTAPRGPVLPHALPGVVSSTSTVPRRVRHQARDAVVLMVFSATSSTVVAAGLLLLAHLARTGR
jgi:hypothetical protein